jgi:LysM domain
MSTIASTRLAASARTVRVRTPPVLTGPIAGPVSARRHLSVVPDGPPARPARPTALRLTRRGRLVVRAGIGVTVVLILVIGLLLGTRSAVAGTSGQPLPVRYHVVLPGETLWGIATALDPHADPRDTVARIVELNALPGSGVRAGQRIALPVGP